MKRIAIALMILGLAACGGSETSDTTAAPAAPSANKMAGSEGAPAAGKATAPVGSGTMAAGESASAAGSASTSPIAQSCLDLVRDAKFTEAVPVCVKAAGMDPENAQVKQALQTARAKAAELPDVAAGAEKAASDAAAKAASDAAAKAGSQMPGAAQGYGQKLGQ